MLIRIESAKYLEEFIAIITNAALSISEGWSGANSESSRDFPFRVVGGNIQGVTATFARLEA